MRFRKSFLSLLSVMFLFSTSMWAQGYRIEVELKGLSKDTLILGEYFTSRMIPKDTIVLDQKGHGVFERKEAFTGGLYLVYVDPAHYFDLLLGDDQNLSISADTTNLVKSVSFSDTDDKLDITNKVLDEMKSAFKKK